MDSNQMGIPRDENEQNRENPVRNGNVLIRNAGPRTDNTDRGSLQIDVTSSIGLIPVDDARVDIYEELPDGSKRMTESLNTDISGQTITVELPAPPIEYSLEPSETRPYANYTIEITAQGYEKVVIEGTQILPEVESIQPVKMIPQEIETEPEEDIIIPSHTLYSVLE